MAYFCSNPWTTVFVWGNGDVTHCCYSNIGALGNINRNSLAEIWQGPKAVYVRRQIARGDYIGAGCEHFCRAFRWNRFYGSQDEIPEISEGLGRLPDFTPGYQLPSPAIIGMELDGKCNFQCAHCLAPKSSRGLSNSNIDALWPYVEQARVIRIVGGEFTVNPRALEHLARLGRMATQPVVFMNTNGHIGLDQYFSTVQDLQRFHLKFSLEGIGPDYSKVRIGGNWKNFQANLMRAGELFAGWNQEGRDWRLYLNFCVMRSNFAKLPEVIEFAVTNNLRMVVNPINGMRHIDENFFMYDHLKVPPEEIEMTVARCHEIIDSRDYIFGRELKQHLDYVIRALNDRKLKISEQSLKFLAARIKGQQLDRLLYIYYKWKLDRRSSLVYLRRKVWKRLKKV